MSPKPNSMRSFFFVVFVLAIPMLLAHTAKSEHTIHHNHKKGFEFIQKLKGCHKGQNTTGLHKLKQYLEKFGYLNSDHDHTKYNDEFDDVLESALKSYQQNYHLQVTGTLDDATSDQMSTPRCGMPDDVNKNHHHRSRKLIHRVSRYSFFNGAPRWGKSQLTYRFTSGDSPITEDVRGACARAFKTWEQVSHFTFQEVFNSASDIEIGFHRGQHGDGFPFDGKGRTLAHAFPPTRGLLHFDADESWTVNPDMDGGVDLESVAVHEIGHILGLGHEPGIPNATMYPAFMVGTVKRNLHSDDIQGIRALYGLGN